MKRPGDFRRNFGKQCGSATEYSAIFNFVAAIAVMSIPLFSRALHGNYSSVTSCIAATGLGAGQESCLAPGSSASNKGGNPGEQTNTGEPANSSEGCDNRDSGNWANSLRTRSLGEPSFSRGGSAACGDVERPNGGGGLEI